LSSPRGSYDVAQGDVSETTVELNEVTEGTVVIGNEEDDNYQANISIVDDDVDGEVVLNFNTFTAGDTNTSVDVVTAEGDDEATLVNQDSTAQGLSTLLDTGDYDISVSSTALDGEDATAALENESDIGSLIISERSTDDMQLWRTTADVRDDVVDVQSDENASAAVGAITSGVEDGVVTRRTRPHSVRPTTLLSTRFPRAASKARSSLWTTTAVALEALADNDDIALNFTEENPGANQDAEEFQLGAGEDVTADDLDVVYDDANGDYYVFLSAGDISSDIEDGDDEYEVDFTVKNEELIDSDDEDDYETVNSTIGFEDAEISFDLNDDDEVEVENAENQSITGTTNVARDGHRRPRPQRGRRDELHQEL